VHELSVTENLLEIALRHARNAQADKITDLYLVIGQLSSIIDDSVQFYWSIVAKDTPAENSTLHFQRIPARFRCNHCSTEYLYSSETMECPNCHSYDIHILTGKEFFLESIKVETNSNENATD
jgi:hydrogenase nickel incorporation protein HypA/HybF